MFRTFSIPITWTELIKRTAKETSADNVLGLAAQLAFYVLFALAPAIVFLVALASYLPGDVIQDMINAVASFAPGDVTQILREQLNSLAGGEHGGLLTFGLLAALWSSSAAMVAITDALNRVYDIEEGRPWWKVRLTAIALTLALAVFVLTATFLVMLGPTIADWLASQMGFGTAFSLAWKILQWPVVLLLVALGIAFINYFAPDAEQDWEWITPGAVISTILWLLASLAFKVYLANFADYNATYGSLGGVIVLMLWFYISAIAILVGAEMNAEIEHASPHGKEPGEKVPGQRKKLGAAAARDHEERQRRLRGEAGGQPRATTPPRPVAPAPAFRSGSGSGFMPGALVFLIVRWFRRERS